jgi:hypothetical protein
VCLQHREDRREFAALEASVPIISPRMRKVVESLVRLGPLADSFAGAGSLSQSAALDLKQNFVSTDPKS